MKLLPFTLELNAHLQPASQVECKAWVTLQASRAFVGSYCVAALNLNLQLVTSSSHK